MTALIVTVIAAAMLVGCATVEDGQHRFMIYRDKGATIGSIREMMVNDLIADGWIVKRGAFEGVRAEKDAGTVTVDYSGHKMRVPARYSLELSLLDAPQGIEIICRDWLVTNPDESVRDIHPVPDGWPKRKAWLESIASRVSVP